MEKNKDTGFFEDLNKSIKFPKGGVYSRVIAKNKNFDYTLMCLAKGTGIDTHTSTKNGGVYVIEGKGTFVLFGKKIAMKPGIFISMPANAPHSLKSTENLAILLCLSK